MSEKEQEYKTPWHRRRLQSFPALRRWHDSPLGTWVGTHPRWFVNTQGSLWGALAIGAVGFAVLTNNAYIAVGVFIFVMLSLPVFLILLAAATEDRE